MSKMESQNSACRLILLLALLLLGSGCRSLFPKSENLTHSRWSSYADAKQAFDQITPLRTPESQLEAMGFGVSSNANVKILTYLDLIQQFIPNQSISKADLDPEVRACIEARDLAKAYMIQLDETRNKRYGNLLLDLLGFKRKSRTTGWQFKGLILVRNDLVVYKLSSGEPNVDKSESKIKPLGPLQEIEGMVVGLIKW